MVKFNFIIFSTLLFAACIYKAGRRHSDINYLWTSSVSPYYIRQYMKTIDSFYANRDFITSEIVNYPDRFIPVTDSGMGFKYVIEFNNMDSLNSLQLNYITLASICDLKKGIWITSRDSLPAHALDQFKLFFEDSILAKVAAQYKGKIADSLLFIGAPNTTVLTPLH